MSSKNKGILLGLIVGLMAFAISLSLVGCSEPDYKQEFPEYRALIEEFEQLTTDGVVPRHYLKAVKYLVQGNERKAHRTLEKAIKRGSDAAALLFSRTVSDSSSALFCSSNFRSVFGTAFNNLALRLYSDKNYDSAVVLHQWTIKIDDSCSTFYSNLGEAYWKQGNTADAFRVWRKAKKLKGIDFRRTVSPYYWEAMKLLVNKVLKGDTTCQVIRFLEKAIQEDPDGASIFLSDTISGTNLKIGSSAIRTYLGTAYRNLALRAVEDPNQDYDSALALLGEAFTTDSLLSNFLYGVGTVYCLQGNLDSAAAIQKRIDSLEKTQRSPPG